MSPRSLLCSFGPLLLAAACSDVDLSTQRSALASEVTPISVDTRGVPRMVQATHSPAAPGATAMQAARTHVARIANVWGVKDTALPELQPLGEVAVRGGTIARIQQVIDGLPVEGGELRVLVRPDGELVTATGTLVGTDAPRSAPAFVADLRDPAGAVARAVAHTYGATFDRSALAGARLAGASNDIVVDEAVAKQVWHRAGHRLVAAWVVEAYTSRAGSTTSELYRTVIAEDGRVISHRSLTADASFKYRVWAETTGELHPLDGPIVDPTPHPTGTPDGNYPAYIAPALVTVDGLNHPGGATTPDPWLATGATETRGNNVDAYTDINPPNGFTAGTDFRATTTAVGTFDRTYNTVAQPLSSQGQQMAAITSLFYSINWLHDFWYDAGFTEAAGNGQAMNYGRGGVEGDALLAEAQDNANGGSRNNANMSTPADGMSPRMQVFLWSGSIDSSLAVANRTPATGTANGFGPPSFNISAGVAIANDGSGTTTDACQALTNNVAGKIVVVDRGTCTFESKALAVQNAGGAGMILVDNQASTTPPGMGGDAMITTPITIGSLSVTMTDGAAIKTAVGAGATSATMRQTAGVELDGGVDATLVAHEFGHYVHHRLQECGTAMCGAISEGWGDFLALMLVARPGDNLDAVYPFAVYATQGFTADPAYFGIRRAPYSTNTAVNSLSFRHMADNEPLPDTHPFNVFGNNAEVHNAGEIWAETMWEAYVNIQKANASFTDARSKMASYVVAGLLLAPTDASPTETRDALLAAAQASSPTDHDAMLAAFAKRGMGSCAVSPPPESTDFIGIVESTEVKGRAEPGVTTFLDTQSCDSDGVLDAGETAKLTIPVQNPGHVAVTDVTVTVTSTTPGITVVSPPVTMTTLAPYTSSDVEVEVKLDAGATGPIDGELAVAISATGSCVPEVTNTVKLRLDVDDVEASSATDTFDTAASVWTPTVDAGDVWKHERETGLDGNWHGLDQGALSDTALVSPALQATADQPVSVTFTHRYSFEFSQDTAFDGGVVEISTDGGATWQDVTALGANPGYGTVAIIGDSGNPLAGRVGFTGDSAGYPGTTTATLDFGTQLAGKTFQLRFRIGTDQAAGAPGWELDDVAFTGIVGTPFPAQVADATDCDGGPGGGDDDGGCCDAGPLRGSNVLAGLAVAALLLRRRRR
ncbi:MAG TPA: M36 family metallopeptidase [Kofleriaceae bacterium]|nr:M36 family metallopeptidase [Kofleriaceae bacterium]